MGDDYDYGDWRGMPWPRVGGVRLPCLLRRLPGGYGILVRRGGWGNCPEHGVHPHPNPPPKGEGIIGGGLREWFRLGDGAEVLGVGVAGAWARERGGAMGGFGWVDIKLGIDYRVGGIYN